MTIETLYNILIWVGIIAIVGLFFGLAFGSNILRDEIDNPAAFMLKARQTDKYKDMAFDKIPRPFSLARTQFAVWTTVISSIYLSYLLKHCMTAETFKLSNNTTTLALLGISAGTTMLSGIIDTTQGTDASTTAPRHQNAPSVSFWVDILSDEKGVSIHRFQNVVWTVVAIIMYFYGLPAGYDACKLPVLDGTILTLAGLSSAAYLGLKINENK